MEKTMNKVELNGYVGMNPEVVTLRSGSKVMRITLATNESFKKNTGEWINNTTWHNIVLWNKLAEMAQEFIKKGSRIALTGKLVNRGFTDKNGQKRMVSEIVAGEVALQTAT